MSCRDADSDDARPMPMVGAGSKVRAEVSPEQFSQLVVALTKVLDLLGEDIDDEELLKTPTRFAQALIDLTSGNRRDLRSEVNGAIIPIDSSSLVIVKELDLHSLCMHHMLGFHGKVHIAYVPKGHSLGLSKFARIVQLYSQRLQMQERLTDEIARAIDEVLKPAGLLVLVRCTHSCMAMRGVREANAETETEFVSGVFKESVHLYHRACVAIRGRV